MLVAGAGLVSALRAPPAPAFGLRKEPYANRQQIDLRMMLERSLRAAVAVLNLQLWAQAQNAGRPKVQRLFLRAIKKPCHRRWQGLFIGCGGRI